MNVSLLRERTPCEANGRLTLAALLILAVLPRKLDIPPASIRRICRPRYLRTARPSTCVRSERFEVGV